jgi:hypothetical protein
MSATDWQQTRLGYEIELLYGKGLPASARIVGEIPVYGSNGVVGFHNKPLVEDPTADRSVCGQASFNLRGANAPFNTSKERHNFVHQLGAQLP